MRFVIILVIAICLVATIKMFFSDETSKPQPLTQHSTPQQTPQASAPDVDNNAQETDKAAYKALVIKTLPPSLQDVGTPAALSVDDSGKLIIDNNLRKLADFYLSALGEESLEDVMIRIEHAIYSQLPESEAKKALELVSGYVDFKQQLSSRMKEFQTLWTEGISLEGIIAVREKINAERAQFLPLEAIEAFFGQEDTYNEFSNNRHKILTNDDLNDTQKQQQLNTLLSQQPDWLIAQYQPARQLADYHSFQDSIENAENRQQLIDEYRQAKFSPEANQRLKELDRQRERWKTRLSNYVKEKQALVAFQDDDSLYQEKLSELKLACFTKPEILRVEALERLGKL